jgi:hypothetical protein
MVIAIVFTASCVTKEVPVTETYYETEYKTEEYNDVEKVITVVKGEDKLEADKYWYIKDLGYGSVTAVLPEHEDIWYHGYDLPQHNTSQLVLDIRPSDTQSYQGIVITSGFVVDVYDMTEVGHLPKWPFVVPKCTHYYDVNEPKRTWTECNVTEDIQAKFEAWLDSVNSQLKSATRLGGVDTPFMTLSGNQPPYIYDVTGIQTIAIIAAGETWQKAQMDPVRSVKLVWSDEIAEEKMVTKQRQIPYQVAKQRTVMQTKKVPFWEAISH